MKLVYLAMFCLLTACSSPGQPSAPSSPLAPAPPVANAPAVPSPAQVIAALPPGSQKTAQQVLSGLNATSTAVPAVGQVVNGIQSNDPQAVANGLNTLTSTVAPFVPPPYQGYALLASLAANLLIPTVMSVIHGKTVRDVASVPGTTTPPAPKG